jgi:two-component system, sensor histidine kinase
VNETRFLQMQPRSIRSHIGDIWSLLTQSAPEQKISSEIEAEQVRVMSEIALTTLPGGFLGIALTTYFLHEKQPHFWLYGWAFLVFLCLLLQLNINFQYKRDPNRFTSRIWLRKFTITAARSAMAWGSVAWFLLPAPMGEEFITVISIFALVAVVASVGGAGSVAFGPLANTFSIISLTVMALGLFLHPSTATITTGLGAIVLLAVQLKLNIGLADQISHSMNLAQEKQSLLQEKESLVQNLQIQTEAAEKSREAAQQADHAKSRFLAAASHDLRAPAHVMVLSLQELLTQITYPQMREKVQRIVYSAVTLQEQLKTILDISTLDNDRLVPILREFGARELLLGIERTHGPDATAAGVSLTVQFSNVIIRSDYEQLHRLLSNLVSNAIRYTKSGHVTIKCRKVGDQLRILVRDTGIGIAKTDQRKIFDEFERIPQPQGEGPKGLGLGLAIVKRIAKLLNHPIGLRSVLYKGSVFWVDVPFVRFEHANQANATQNTVSIQPVAGSFIAVIDDEQATIDAHQSLLMRAGCEVMAALSIDDAIEKLQRCDRIPDGILCDYDLGNGRTGIEAINRIRDDQRANIPAVILTGDVMAVQTIRLRLSNCDVLIKPTRSEEILKQLSVVLAQAIPTEKQAEL